MKNGWTGGQYSLVRALLGAWLAVRFLSLWLNAGEAFPESGVLPTAEPPSLAWIPNVLALGASPGLVGAWLSLAVLASLALLLGRGDRWAACIAAYLWLCLCQRNPAVANPPLPLVAPLLVLHAFTPRAPYGSWDARGRSDPDGGWRLPPRLHLLAWVVTAAAYFVLAERSFDAFAPDGPGPLAAAGIRPELRGWATQGAARPVAYAVLALHLAYPLLSLMRVTRPWVWSAMLLARVAAVPLLDAPWGWSALVLVHLITFDPAWIRASTTAGARLFYDGHCGLCHRSMRFVLAEDRGARFRYAPLQGDTFQALVPEARRSGLPDSIVLATEDGRLWVRSDSALEVLRRLGGAWRLAALALGIVPRAVRDAGYDLVARVRLRLFPRPEGVCPVVPADLAGRFEP